jgi:hypothetical protein
MQENIHDQILELGKDIEQLNTEIEFRKTNGLDTKELEEKLFGLELEACMLSSSTRERKPPIESKGKHYPVPANPTKAYLFQATENFVSKVEESFGNGDWEELCRVLHHDGQRLFLTYSAYFTTDRIGDMEFRCADYEVPETTEAARKQLNKLLNLLYECLDVGIDLLWQGNEVESAIRLFPLDDISTMMCVDLSIMDPNIRV